MINYIFLFFSFFLSQDIINKIDTTIKLEFDTIVVDGALIDTLSIQNDYEDIFCLGCDIIQNVLGINRKHTFEWKKCTNEKNTSSNSDFINPSKNIFYFVSKIANILKNNGYNINETTFHIDFHRYNLFGEKFITELGWHEDDYGGTNYKVNTAIIYLRKDKTLRGGNLLVKNKTCQTELISDNTIILIDGRITHKPEDIEGFGCRDSIVIQFERI